MPYRALAATVLLAGAAVSLPALAAEHPIGKPVVKHHMIIAAVYLQPVHMAPKLPGNNQGDVHMEADIHADKNEPHGFSPGAWMPYLTVTYQITKKGSDWSNFGHFIPMVADDGPHYGANVKLDGAGEYHVAYRILPPSYSGFFHHIDKDTGVPGWWAPIKVSWDFTYVGVGKKGGY